MEKKVVIALGGNAILQPKQVATYENQLSNVQKSSEIIVNLIKEGYKVLITHGNGPQVGNILRQNEEVKDIVPPLPLDVCSAQSQGFIGYMIEQSLKNELYKQGINRQVVTILTTTEVSPNDPAFKKPTKPIGKFYTKEEAVNHALDKKWLVNNDAGRGWRRIVPSPMPTTITNADVIKQLVDLEIIVIASGGGGIPVIKDDDGLYSGIEAVIDKDRSGRKLAEEVKADILMILTDVKNVYVNYGKENEKVLRNISVNEAKRYVEEGQFAVGSMGPKIESAIKFAEHGGKSIICSLFEADLAIKGEAGTIITK